MNFEEEMKRLVVLQAEKISMEFTIVDFTKKVLEANEKGKFICEEAAIEFLNDLKSHYMEFIIKVAEEKVITLFEEKAAEIVASRESSIEEVEDLNELEEVSLEPEEGEDDLKYVIRNDIYKKNIEIEKTQGKFKEEDTENYWMIGVDINQVPEEELQKMSIFDMDFW
mgnify:CR=1 FL=1